LGLAMVLRKALRRFFENDCIVLGFEKACT